MRGSSGASEGLAKSQPLVLDLAAEVAFHYLLPDTVNYACLGPCLLYGTGQSPGACREAKRRFALPWEAGAFLPSFPSLGFGFRGGGQSLSMLAKCSTTEHIPALHTFLSEKKYLFVSLGGTHTDTDNEMNFCINGKKYLSFSLEGTHTDTDNEFLYAQHSA